MAQINLIIHLVFVFLLFIAQCYVVGHSLVSITTLDDYMQTGNSPNDVSLND